MTDTGSDLASLEPLEPLAAAAPTAMDDPLAAQRGGLAAPAYNAYCKDKAFYQFLFAGVVMLVGTLLPYNAEGRAYYNTMSGAFTMLLGIAMIWTWWGAISNNRSNNASLKWLLFCMAPLIAGIWNMVAFDITKAMEVATANNWMPADAVASDGWGGLMGDMFGGLAKRNHEWMARADVFWRAFGPANFVVMFGALLAEFGFLMGVVGGAKQNKQVTKQKQMKAAERRRK